MEVIIPTISRLGFQLVKPAETTIVFNDNHYTYLSFGTAIYEDDTEGRYFYYQGSVTKESVTHIRLLNDDTEKHYLVEILMTGFAVDEYYFAKRKDAEKAYAQFCEWRYGK